MSRARKRPRATGKEREEGQRTDEQLDEADHAVKHGDLGLLEEVVAPAQLARSGLELAAGELATLAGVQVGGRARRAVREVDRADAEELRVRARARAERAQDGDGALLRRVERVEVRLVEPDALGEGLDAGQLGAAGVEGGCGRREPESGRAREGEVEGEGGTHRP